jgi:bacterioferritin-associated ferredoxin
MNRDEYVQKLKAQVDQWNAQMATWEKASEDVKNKYLQQLDEARVRRDEAIAEMKRLQGASADAMRAWILAPVAAPPRGSFNRGAVVCNCFDVSEVEITSVLAAGADLGQLQGRLKCGAECGSCLPELKRMVQSAALQRAAGAAAAGAQVPGSAPIPQSRILNS